MSFDKKEQAAAHSQVFNIETLVGVAGNLTNSSVTIYDYSSIHQTLRNAGITQDQRNELENIMDELKTTEPIKKQALFERAKSWIAKNQDFLGATASVVRKALGLE